MLNSRKEAYEFLNMLQAPEQLILHVKLVGEAADILIEALEGFQCKLDFNFIRTGVAIHDIGKVVRHNEMFELGSEHEPEGQKLLLKNGASTKLARVCLSHARWQEMECSIEELIIALSDKLWKGKRVEVLEQAVIDKIAEYLGHDKWDIFTSLDTVFENIAAEGHKRLQRSVS